MSKRRKGPFEYDVCLSFAGEDRKYVAAVAAELKAEGIRVFFDEYEEVALWGKDLYEHLHDVYSQLARYCVLFISKRYGKKLWTNHERKSAQERAFKQHSEYILPARFDDTEVPGMRDTISYIELTGRTPKAFAKMVAAKLGPRQREDYFPPIADRLMDERPLDGEKDPEIIQGMAESFYSAMRRTNKRERKVVFAILLGGCKAELPENVHINLDLLRRVTHIAPAVLKRIVGGLSSLGFSSRVRRGHGGKAELLKQEFLVLEYDCLKMEMGPATETAVTMTRLGAEDHCLDCGIKALMRLDFGNLASSTHVRYRRKKKERRRGIRRS